MCREGTDHPGSSVVVLVGVFCHPLHTGVVDVGVQAAIGAAQPSLFVANQVQVLLRDLVQGLVPAGNPHVVEIVRQEPVVAALALDEVELPGGSQGFLVDSEVRNRRGREKATHFRRLVLQARDVSRQHVGV